jgi:hypothetical protein
MLQDAAEFFGPSIDFRSVTVKASLAIIKGRPWTAGNTIRFGRPNQTGSGPDLETVIHELGHVWEHQNGQTQIISGAVEQLGRLLVPGYNPYDYGGPTGVSGGRQLPQYSKEGQAQILQNYWRSVHGFSTDAGGHSFTPAYAADLQRLVTAAGIGSSAPRAPTRTAGGIVDSIVVALVNISLALFGQ